jgi:hypothetical protein
LSSLQQAHGEEYFAISLANQPQLRSYGNHSDCYVFGVLTKRNDNKVGRLCFHTHFENHVGFVLVTLDGFSEEALRFSNVPYKIVKVFKERAKVEELFAVAIHSLLEYGKAQPDHDEAVRLLAAQQFFAKLLPTDSREGFSEVLASQLVSLDIRMGRARLAVHRELQKNQDQQTVLLQRLRELT